MTSFITQQEQAHTRTSILVIYFVLSITCIVGLIYLGLASVFVDRGWWSAGLFLWSSGITLGIMLIGVVVKFGELSKGGPAIAQMLRGRLLLRHSLSPEEQRLINVVDEMAIASGVPVPEVYILDHEQSINAFAAGYTMNDAVIGVTAGCVNKLTREELQGVVAHEFSHILNGDMSLNLRLTGWINGLVGIAVVGRVILEMIGHAGDADEFGCLLIIPAFVVGVVFLSLGWIGVLFGRLIQAAISRHREYLADASAVQFTRNPEGLAGALGKIASGNSWLKCAHSEEASHFLFSDGIKGRWFASFSTHPPIADRLKRLGSVAIDRASAPGPQQVLDLKSPANGLASLPPALPSPPPSPSTSAALPQLGALDEAHVDYARGLLANVPDSLRSAVAELLPATALVYATLLGSDSETREKQFRLLEGTGDATSSEVRRLHAILVETDMRLRLPLVELAIPTLHQVSSAQFEQFCDRLHELIHADHRVDLFEFALEKMVIHQLAPHFRRRAKPELRHHSLKPVFDDCRLLLSALAHLSHQDAGQVRVAFETGMSHIQAHNKMTLVPLDECGLDKVDQALTELARTPVAARRTLVSACASAITADGVIEPGEAELLRAICAALDIPCPPLMQYP